MRNLNYELKQLCRRNRDGSFATSAIASACSTWWRISFTRWAIDTWLQQSLKPKHVEGLVERWQAEGLPWARSRTGWRAAMVGREDRQTERHRPRQRPLRHRQPAVRHQRQQGAATDRRRARQDHGSVHGDVAAAAGGLRAAARGVDQDPSGVGRPWRPAGAQGHLDQGGRPREIPIRNAEQRQVLDEAKALAGRGSLIPAERSYVEQLRRFEYQCAAAGAHRIHGHRHQYAQTRYRELTGWPAPAAGGPRSRDLTPSQREADREAGSRSAKSWGTSAQQITAVYLGR